MKDSDFLFSTNALDILIEPLECVSDNSVSIKVGLHVLAVRGNLAAPFAEGDCTNCHVLNYEAIYLYFVGAKAC